VTLAVYPVDRFNNNALSHCVQENNLERNKGMTSKLQQWIAGQTRPDQSSVTVRPIRPSDVNLITEMHRRKQNKKGK